MHALLVDDHRKSMPDRSRRWHCPDDHEALMFCKGQGTLLYSALLQCLTEKGYHLVIGGIAQPNASSAALHEKMGFEKVGEFKEVGFKFDRRVDVGYWQITLGLPSA